MTISRWCSSTQQGYERDRKDVRNIIEQEQSLQLFQKARPPIPMKVILLVVAGSVAKQIHLLLHKTGSACPQSHDPQLKLQPCCTKTLKYKRHAVYLRNQQMAYIYHRSETNFRGILQFKYLRTNIYGSYHCSAFL